MKMLGRPRSLDPGFHTAVVLPRSLHEKLVEAAKENRTTLSSEIRERLMRSFVVPTQAIDEITTLATALEQAAARLRGGIEP